MFIRAAIAKSRFEMLAAAAVAATAVVATAAAVVVTAAAVAMAVPISRPTCSEGGEDAHNDDSKAAPAFIRRLS
jgi:hypothetical protein